MAVATHIVTSHNFIEATMKTNFVNSIEEATELASRLFNMGDRDIFISEIKTRKYGKRY